MVDAAPIIAELSCRICLASCGPNDLDATSVADDYKQCVGFEITEEDGALKLCQICMAELSLVKRFHNKCKTSELRLIKFRAENWGRQQEVCNANDEPMIPVNFNPNEMDITVSMPLQVNVGGSSSSLPPEKPVKRGPGRPKKIKPVESNSGGPWWGHGGPNHQVAAAAAAAAVAVQMKIRAAEHRGPGRPKKIVEPFSQPLPQDPFAALPLANPYNDRVPNNLLNQFLNTSNETSIKHNHAINSSASSSNSAAAVPFFCGICQQRFPFKSQHEKHMHMKMHYGNAAVSDNFPGAGGLYGGAAGVHGDFHNSLDPRMHHFVYPNKFTQHPKGYQNATHFPHRIAK